MQWRRDLWLLVLAVGAGLFVAGERTLAATNDPGLITPLVLVGAATAPTAFIALAGGRDLRGTLPSAVLVGTSVLAGLFGAALAGLLTYGTLRSLRPGPTLTVAVVEEAVTLLVPAAVLWALPTRRAADGLLVGAAAGAGFATTETLSYLVTTLVGNGGAIDGVSHELLVRELLGPAAHLAWTGIAAAALWMAAHERWSARSLRRFGLAAAGVVLLHLAWEVGHTLLLQLLCTLVTLALLDWVVRYITPPRRPAPRPAGQSSGRLTAALNRAAQHARPPREAASVPSPGPDAPTLVVELDFAEAPSAASATLPSPTTTRPSAEPAAAYPDAEATPTFDDVWSDDDAATPADHSRPASVPSPDAAPEETATTDPAPEADHIEADAAPEPRTAGPRPSGDDTVDLTPPSGTSAGPADVPAAGPTRASASPFERPSTSANESTESTRPSASADEPTAGAEPAPDPAEWPFDGTWTTPGEATAPADEVSSDDPWAAEAAAAKGLATPPADSSSPGSPHPDDEAASSAAGVVLADSPHAADPRPTRRRATATTDKTAAPAAPATAAALAGAPPAADLTSARRRTNDKAAAPADPGTPAPTDIPLLTGPSPVRRRTIGKNETAIPAEGSGAATAAAGSTGSTEPTDAAAGKRRRAAKSSTAAPEAAPATSSARPTKRKPVIPAMTEVGTRPTPAAEAAKTVGAEAQATSERVVGTADGPEPADERRDPAEAGQGALFETPDKAREGAATPVTEIVEAPAAMLAPPNQARTVEGGPRVVPAAPRKGRSGKAIPETDDAPGTTPARARTGRPKPTPAKPAGSKPIQATSPQPKAPRPKAPRPKTSQPED